MKYHLKGRALTLVEDGVVISLSVFNHIISRIDVPHDLCYVDVKVNTARYLRISPSGDRVIISNDTTGLTVLTPYYLIGKDLINALNAGYTPWFDGDAFPVGNVSVWLSDSGKGTQYLDAERWDWANDRGIVAFKWSKSSIESRVLAEKVSAAQILEASLTHLKERAVTYDKPEGERSIEAVVSAFKAITVDGLMNTEERGWMFMTLLKLVRSQQGAYKADSYEDGASYFALQGEAAARERGNNNGETKTN